MKLHTPKDGPAPRRKAKPKPNPLDHLPEYQALVSSIVNGKMKPHEVWGVYLDGADAERPGLKAPWRTVTDRLRSLIRSLHLESDYSVNKYTTSTPGVWFVQVHYDPPMAATPLPRRAAR